MGALAVGRGVGREVGEIGIVWTESAVVSMGVCGGFMYPRSPVSMRTYVKSDDLMCMNSKQMRTMLQIHAMQIYE